MTHIKKSPWLRVLAVTVAVLIAVAIGFFFPEKISVTAADIITYDPTNPDNPMTVTASVIVNGHPIQDDTILNDGDAIEFSFDWLLKDNGKSYANSTFSFDLSRYLKGIKLNDCSNDIYDGEGKLKARYIISGDTLTVTLGSMFSENWKDRKGSGTFSGEIALDQTSQNPDGSYPIEFFGTTVNIIKYGDIPELSMTKSAVGKLQKNSDGKYYQSYSVAVTNSGADASNVVIKDTPSAEGLFKGGIQNVTVTGAASAVNGNTITLTTVPANSTVTVTYDIEVDITQYASDPSYSSRKNTAELTHNETTITKDAYLTVENTPSIGKTASYNESKKEITWTITVNPGILGADAAFSIEDTLDSQLSYNGSNSFNFAKTDFTANADGTYTKSYTTTVPDDILNRVTNTDLTNKAAVSFPEYSINKETTAGYTVKANPVDYVKKSDGTLSGNNISWTVEVVIPNKDVTSVTVNDSLDFRYDVANTDKHGLGYDLSSVAINGEKVITVDGPIMTSKGDWANINTTNVTFKYGEISGRFHDFIDGAATDEDNLTGLTLKITDKNFLAKNKGKTITLTYNTTVDTEAPSYIVNKAQTVIEMADNPTIDKTATGNYVPPLSLLKGDGYTLQNTYSEIYNKLRNRKNWCLEVKPGVKSYAEGQTIAITDTVTPSDYISFVTGAEVAALDGVSDAYKSKFSDGFYIAYVGDTEYANCVKFTGSGFNVTLSSQLAAALNSGNSLKIEYATHMDDTAYGKFNTLTGTQNFKNGAVAEYDSRSFPAKPYEFSYDPKPLSLGSKTAAEGTETIGNTTIYYAWYTVTINEEAVDLSDTDEFTVTDHMGTNLKLAENPISIEPSEGASYTVSGQDINFTFKDNKKYVVKYRANIKQISKNEVVTDEQITAMFSNTITLKGLSGNNVSSVASISEDSFRSKFAASSDNENTVITISGTKTWVDNGFTGIHPKNISLKLHAEKTAKAESGMTDTTEDTIHEITVADSEDGSWSYTITNLPKTDADYTYEYTVTELKVDGYTVTYTNGVDTDNSLIVGAENKAELNLTNTFTAHKTELGKLTVNKVWENDTAAERPAVKFTLTCDKAGYEYSKSIELGSASSVVFEDVPLYSYSRNAADELVRTPLEYTLTETKADGTPVEAPYTVTYSEQTFTLADAVVTTPATNVTKAVTVTNTKKIVIAKPIEIIKTYTISEGTLTDAELDAAAAGTVFTLSDITDTNNASIDGIPVITSGNQAIVTFSEGLTAGHTYKLVETKAPDGFTKSNVIVYCRIDALTGEVTYSTSLNGTYTAVFPTIENVKTISATETTTETTTVPDVTTDTTTETTTVPDVTTDTTTETTTVPDVTTDTTTETTTVPDVTTDTTTETTTVPDVTADTTTETTTVPDVTTDSSTGTTTVPDVTTDTTTETTTVPDVTTDTTVTFTETTPDITTQTTVTTTETTTVTTVTTFDIPWITTTNTDWYIYAFGGRVTQRPEEDNSEDVGAGAGITDAHEADNNSSDRTLIAITAVCAIAITSAVTVACRKKSGSK